MNNLIRVEDAKLYLAKNYIDGNKSLGQCLDEVPTVNAIVIPNNATNGDVIKALFPDVKIHQSGGYTGCLFRPSVMLDDIRSEWWNAPYKAESEDKE